MKTTHTRFSRDLSAGPDAFVFSVNAGYPADNALELASVIMDAALQTLIDAAANLPPNAETAAIYTALYSLDQAHALIKAVMPFGDDVQGEQEGGQ